jgi:hypothetical protein
MISIKYIAVLILGTTLIWGQNLAPHPIPGNGESVAPVLREAPTPAAPQNQERQPSLTFEDVFHILNPREDGTYADNTDPDVLVFSISDDEKKEIRIAVNKALVLKYSEIIRALYDGEDDLKGPIPLDNSKNPFFQNIRLETFQTLMKLLFTYDQNPIAYNDGQNFDVTANNIPALLNLANYLFADNTVHQWGAVSENDLGFFHALLRSFFSFIFDPQSVQKSQEQTEDAPIFRLPLPTNIYDTALPWAKPSEIYGFYKTLIKLSENKQITLDQDAFNLVEKLNAYFPQERLFRYWSELNSLVWKGSELDVFYKGSDMRQQAFDDLSQQFISFSDIRSDQNVSQTHIVIRHSDLSQNKDVLDQFFKQNPDKILVVDFGNATAIGNKFLVPYSVQHLMIVGGNITTIGDDFLKDSFELKSLRLPPNLTTVGDNFLSNCWALKFLDLPLNLTTVGNYFLSSCYALESLRLPPNLTTVGDNFLSNCRALKFLDLSHLHLTIVDDGFLRGCINLTSVILPPNLTAVGHYFLVNCTMLASVDLPPNLRTVGNGFLAGCRGLISLDLPPNLTTVGNGFLADCSGLISLDLPPNLTTVGDEFLRHSFGLKSLRLSPNLTTVGDSFLSGCSSLVSVDLSPNLTAVGHWFLFQCESLTSVILPKSLTTVGIGFLGGIQGLQELTLSQPLATIMTPRLQASNPQLRITIREE